MQADGTARALGDERTTHQDPDQQSTEAAIVALLLAHEHAGIWTQAEIERELSASPLTVKDSLATLTAAGLIHRHNELVLPTRAAQRMDELAL
jgi:DNA-binding HxlR family transcriptional regulator